MPQPLVVPSEIPWKDLTGNALEEALYWLVHSMGAKDLEWRQGSATSGAPDGGRDLAAVFQVPTPDGQIRKETWWFEAKGRLRTVEPDAVKTAVLNAAGRSDVDVLVVATNVVFSNPTLDWVTRWQSSTARPIVRLWNRNDLERQFCERPDVVLRLFSRALSTQGKLEVVRSRFWNYQFYAGGPLLEELWKHRDDLQWSDGDIIAALVSECANGSVTDRPWATLIPPGQQLGVLGIALSRILYFCFRADDAGVSQKPYLDGCAYLLLLCLRSHDRKQISRTIGKIWPGRNRHIEKVRRHALLPVLQTLRSELRDVCINDCPRVSADPLSLSPQQVDDYWLRLRARASADVQSKRERVILVMEKDYESCRVGFSLNKSVRCPIVRNKFDDETPLDLHRVLDTLRAIVIARAEPRGTDPRRAKKSG